MNHFLSCRFHLPALGIKREQRGKAMGGSELVFLLDKLTNVSLSITLICSFSQSWPCKCAKILVETHQVRNFTALLEGSDSVMLGS